MSNQNDFVIENGILKKYIGNDSVVTVPNLVKSIGDYAFYDCKFIISVILPEHLKYIGKEAFHGCTGIKNLTMPKRISSIRESAFYGCSGLMSIVLPDGLKTISAYAFFDCLCLTSIMLPEGLTSIGNSAFSGCESLTSVTLPEGLTSIGDSAFSGCGSLTSVTLSEGLTSIGDSAFRGCEKLADKNGFVVYQGILFDYFGNETNVVIPKSIIRISDYSFDSGFQRGSGKAPLIQKITLHEEIVSIGTGAFCRSFAVQVEMPLRCPLWETSGKATAYGFAQSIISHTGSVLSFFDENGKTAAKIVLAHDGESDPKKNGAILSIRQEDHRFDFENYDTYFASLAKKENKIRVALVRLEYPYALSAAMEDVYRSYIKHNAEIAGEILIDEENGVMLTRLCAEKFFSHIITQHLSDYAQQKKTQRLQRSYWITHMRISAANLYLPYRSFLRSKYCQI